MYNLMCLFLIFIIYSIIGYIAEIIYCTIEAKSLVLNRGFLIGPYLPIYGVGGMMISFVLGKYADDPLTLFILSIVYCTILEYLTSWILEKIFHLRWWDYSHMKFNINGRVCLLNGVLFGISGLLIVEIVNSLITNIIYSGNSLVIMIIGSIVFGLFLSDVIVSTRILFGLKENITKITSKDNTRQIKKEVKEFLSNYRVLTGRLLKSFPDLEKLNGAGFTKIKKVFDNVIKELGKIKPKVRIK